MKKLLLTGFPLAVVLLSIRPLSAQVQGQFVTDGPMQSTREFNAQVLMKTGKVLSMGGVDNNNNLLSSAEVFNPVTGTWSLTGSMAEAREEFPAVVLASGKVLVSGGLGNAGTVLSGAELYDPATGTWSLAGSLSVARFGHTATLLYNGKVLVAGGCIAVAINCSTTAVSELYDPTSNSWSETGSLHTARSDHTAVRLTSGKVLVIGGSTGTATTSCELYDPFKGAWSVAAGTNVARVLHGASLLRDGKVLVTGGLTGHSALSSAELYNPTANTWTLTGSMTIGHRAHTATLLGDGTVLVAGGEGQPNSNSVIPTAIAEIYNEATGKFTATASLSRALAYHSATLLGNGRALVDGGAGTTTVCCVVVNTSEVYTPLTMTFSTGSLSFGVLQIGLSSASQPVTVTNVSSHPVTISKIATSANFSQSNTCLTSPTTPTTLNPGQNCTITVTFTPVTAGTHTGALTLLDNDPGSPTQTIALTGIGAAHAITPLPGNLSFPGQSPGTSSTLSVTLQNDGTSAVNITTIGISSANAFSQTNNCPAALNPNQNCVIQVVFTPPDAGTFKATLSVTDTDISSPHATVSLSGIGLNN